MIVEALRIAPCMGGWCSRRERCAHYWSTVVWKGPSERLCSDRFDEFVLAEKRPAGAPVALAEAEL